MAAVAGYAAQVRIGASAVVADSMKWSLSVDMDSLDTTPLAATGGAKTMIPGLYGASGSIDCNFNYADTTGQKAIHDAFFARASITLNLDTAASGTNRTYSGTAYITGIKPEASVGDLVKMSFSFQFTGAVTFA